MSSTIASVPATLDSPVALRRFLQELVDNIDVVLGFKGDTKFLTDKDVKEDLSNLADLAKSLSEQKEAVESVKSSIESIEESIDDINDSLEDLANAKSTTELDDTFRDLNYTGWGDTYGNLELTALGSEIANSPMVLDANTSYTLLADSIKCANFVKTTLWIVQGTTINIFLRVGTDSTWKKLAEEVTP